MASHGDAGTGNRVTKRSQFNYGMGIAFGQFTAVLVFLHIPLLSHIQIIMKPKSGFLRCSVALLGMAAPLVQGAVLAQWDTNGFTGTETSILSSGVATGLSVTAIGIGSELSTTSGGGGVNTTSWSTALNATGNNYYGFSMTVGATYEVKLTTWEFTARSSNTGPGNFVVRYSGDSFASI